MTELLRETEGRLTVLHSQHDRLVELADVWVGPGAHLVHQRADVHPSRVAALLTQQIAHIRLPANG